LNILLAAGNFHSILAKHFDTVVNAKQLSCYELTAFIEETHPLTDVILITDDAFDKSARGAAQALSDLTACLEMRNISAEIVLVTNSLQLVNTSFSPKVNVEYVPSNRISFEEYVKCARKYYREKASQEKEKKPSHWWNKKITPSHETSGTENTSVLSHGISRTIAITGHRGSGVTGTAANIAQEAQKQGLTAIIIDLDTVTRGMNMYYGAYMETDDEDKKSSLIRLLARPQNYESCAYSIKPGLYMSTLPYDFEDKKLQEQFVTGEKIISMLSVLKSKFNLCIIDLPLEVAAAHKEILIHVDYFGLCLNNSLYSVFNTVRQLDYYLEKQYLDLLISKSKIIVTQYNDKAVNQGENFSPKRVCEVLKTVSPMFEYAGEAAGYVPENSEFDMQIETEILICESNEKMHEAYKKILIKILEGAD